MKRNFIKSYLMKLLAGCFLMVAACLQASAQITVTATAGVTGPTAYAQLRLAFNAINAGTHQGAITITVNAGTFETATAVLNQNAAPANYTSVLIKPAVGATPTISGNLAGTAIVYLFGASNVTIDGSNTVGGTSRDLTITNTTGTAGSTVIRFGSPTTTVGATNNVVKNCQVRMNSSLVGLAIVSGSGVTLFGIAEAPNSNNTIENNAISNTQTAFYAYGPNATWDANWTIQRNDMTNLGFTGIHVNNGNGTRILDNNISNISINGAQSTSGIVLSFEARNTTIARNKISNVNNTVNNGAYGMYFDVNPTSVNINVHNNFVLNATCPAGGAVWQNGHGIYTDLGSGFNFHHNTVQLATNSAAGATNGVFTFDPFAALGGIVAGSVNMQDNIVSNIQTAGNRYGVYSTGTNAMFSAIDYNDYNVTSGNLGFIGGLNRTTIAAMQAGFGGNVNSITTAPTFVSATDLHLQNVAANYPLAAGIAITTPVINTDIDVAPRNTTRPTIGAHELANRIQYTNLPNSCSDTSWVLNAVNIDAPVGIATAGATIPRVYFRKGAGAWFSAAGTQTSGTAITGVWSFTISATAMGGVAAGDVISYYVIAQTGPGSMVFSTPSAGLVATDVNTVTTHPTAPNTFIVNTIRMTGLSTSQSVCFSSTAQTAPYFYTGTSGAPSQYILSWAPAGPSPVLVYAPLPASPINVNVPALTAQGNYTGTLTIRNPTTTCTATYTVSLTVNPPLAVTGPSSVCVGATVVYSGSVGGGTWSSSAPAVATIASASGALTGVSMGTTIISYVSPSGCVGVSTVTVAAPPGAVSGGATPICPNTSLTLTNSSPGGTWVSGNPGVASVGSSSGVVTGTGAGTAVITYSVAGCIPALATVTVNPAPNPITGTLFACQGATTTLSTTSTGGSWISGAPAVATVGSSTGVVSGIAPGTATISYRFTSSGCVSTNTVNIFDTPDTIIGGPTICEGLSIALSSDIAGGTWSTSLPGIISVVSTTGIATANSPSGTVTVTYTMPTGCIKTKLLNVSTAPTTISGSSHVICSGYSMPLSNGTPGGTWSSSNPAVGTVSATGVFHAIAAGVVTINYNTTSCNPATYTITVNQTPKPITGGITICDGSSTTTINDSTLGGTWTINSLPAGATITSIGVVGGLQTAIVNGMTIGGTHLVTYTVPNGCFVNAPIIVDVPPAPITGPDSLCMGTSSSLSNATPDGIWSSSNSMIASIVATTGAVTGVNAGIVTITYAKVSGCYTTKNFKVRTPLPASVSISRFPAIDTLCAGTPVTFTAHSVNGGVSPGFIWQIFGSTVFTGDSVFTYTPTHGDVVSVYMSYSPDVCSFPVSAYANIPINVYPNVSPVVVITTSSPTTVSYIGQTVTFFAEATTAGGSPTYQWFVDSELIPGATNNVFVREVYNTDTVWCRVNGQPACETGYSALSNKIVILADYLNVHNSAVVGTNLTLFPNPNTGSFTLNGTVGVVNGMSHYDVVNVLGQTVATGNMTIKNGEVNETISLNNLTPGTYMLKVQTESGDKLFHFVVAH